MATIERRGAPRVIAFAVLAGLAQGCAAAMAPVSGATQLLEQDRSARQRQEMDRRVAEAQAERKSQRATRPTTPPSAEDLADVQPLGDSKTATVTSAEDARIRAEVEASWAEHERANREDGADLIDRVCAALTDALEAQDALDEDDRIAKISGTSNLGARHEAGRRIDAATQEMRVALTEWKARFGERKISESPYECSDPAASYALSQLGQAQRSR